MMGALLQRGNVVCYIYTTVFTSDARWNVGQKSKLLRKLGRITRAAVVFSLCDILEWKINVDAYLFVNGLIGLFTIRPLFIVSVVWRKGRGISKNTSFIFYLSWEIQPRVQSQLQQTCLYMFSRQIYYYLVLAIVRTFKKTQTTVWTFQTLEK